MTCYCRLLIPPVDSSPRYLPVILLLSIFWLTLKDRSCISQLLPQSDFPMTQGHHLFHAGHNIGWTFSWSLDHFLCNSTLLMFFSCTWEGNEECCREEALAEWFRTFWTFFWFRLEKIWIWLFWFFLFSFSSSLLRMRTSSNSFWWSMSYQARERTIHWFTGRRWRNEGCIS